MRALSPSLLLLLLLLLSSPPCAGLGYVGLACLYFLRVAVYFPRAEGLKSLLASRPRDDFVEVTSRSRAVISFVRNDLPRETGLAAPGCNRERASVYERLHPFAKTARIGQRWNVSVKCRSSPRLLVFSSLSGNRFELRVGDFVKKKNTY